MHTEQWNEVDVYAQHKTKNSKSELRIFRSQ